MKKVKQIVSVVLCLLMLVAVVPVMEVGATQTRSYNFNDAEYSSDPGQYMVNIATAQLGRTGSSLGYTEEWCADFVSDCAKIAGQSAAIPAHGVVSGVGNNILNAGGYVVSAASAKPGDIVIIDWDGNGRQNHVEIVYAISGASVYSIGGNTGVSNANLYTRKVAKHSPLSSSVITKIIRPNYTKVEPTYADLGDDFWAYLGNQGCGKWVAGQGNNVQGEACTGDINQMWHFIRQENGSYCILCLSNSYAMNVSNASSTAGANLQLAPYVASKEQQFYIYIKDSAYYFKVAYANLWVEMDQSNFNIAMWNERSDYGPQKYNIQRIDYKGYLPQNIGTDFYAIIKNSSTGKWLTDRNYNVQGEDAACAYNQIWHFVRHGDRCYSMLCNTTNAMDISHGSSTAGSNLQIMPYVANAAQRFYIYYKDGGYYFKSSYTDLMIDMDQSDFNVAMWNCDMNSPAHKFEIIKVSKDFTHTWNNGIVTKAATCSAVGTKTYTCTTCNATKTETIAINASNHVNTKNVAATASTCTAKGYTAGVYCNDCKKYISGHAEQPLAAHKTTTQNAKAATCTAEGYTGDQVCSVCKQTITKGTAIAKKAHTLTTVNQKSAGCTTAGYTGDQYCTTCKQTITKGSAVAALGHTSPDGNGNCTRCGTHIKDVTPSQPSNPQPNPNACKYCGQVHTGPFGWLIKFFHSILAIFKR